MKPTPKPLLPSRTQVKRRATAGETAGMLHALRACRMPAGCPEPMLATLGVMPDALDDFGYEVKWDGYRALMRWDGHSLKLSSRNCNDLATRFPEIAARRSPLRHQLILDGELVAMDRSGAPSFSALQTRMSGPRGIARGRAWDPRRYRLQYMIFDVLYHAGRSTCALAYRDRRALLESLPLSVGAWMVPPTHPDGPALLELMRQADQEGIIAKRLDSSYQPGRRSPDWIKVKLNRRDEFIIVGYWSSGRHGLSSLLLGYYPDPSAARVGDDLRYCGKVGTGFDERGREQLREALMKLRVADPPCTGSLPHGAGITWCRPRLVAQIAFTQWTHDGALRHPSFLGLRSDKRADQVVYAAAERGGP